MTLLRAVLLLLGVLVSLGGCSDITGPVFGSVTDGMPAAFGDFNSDELTDVFVIRDNSQTLEILLAHEEEPLLRPVRSNPLKCKFENAKITSVAPGDFDGDAFMDVMVTTKRYRPGSEERFEHTYVHILWGGLNHLNCSHEEKAIPMRGQPLVMDYNQDMILDLFGEHSDGRKMFWIFNDTRKPPEEITMRDNKSTPLMSPHANAFIDLNEDYMADLFITTTQSFEIWHGLEQRGFAFNKTIDFPPNASVIGQSLFMDVELKGQMDLLTPVCKDKSCTDNALMAYSNGEWHNLQVNFKDDNMIPWRYAQKKGAKYIDTITLHSGDFNMDGYPDIIATLQPVKEEHPRSFLLENVPCPSGCGKFTRSFVIRWNALNPFKNQTAMAAFFDFYQDGILDVILVTYDGKDTYKAAAFKNSLDYDANFIKVMVLTGLTNKNNPMMMGRVGKKRRTYGTNLPGPLISYKTTTQEGFMRHGASPQLAQSAHFSLNLPYAIFGLGRTPNFVDSLTVGLSNHSRCWTQIIPNSQMVVIPWPPNQPSRWKAQLFVTPSKLILMSVAALTAICGLITVIIGVLHWKERQEDKKERLSESHRFHFDAM